MSKDGSKEMEKTRKNEFPVCLLAGRPQHKFLVSKLLRSRAAMLHNSRNSTYIVL
jgi:hypothetical protein